MTNVAAGPFKKTQLAGLYGALDDAIKEYAKTHYVTYAEIFGVLDILKLDLYRDLLTEGVDEE